MEFFLKFNVIGNSGLCSKHFKVPYFKRPIYMPGFLSGFDNMERYWRRRTNFRRSCGKSKRIKWKLSEECRKQQVNHLKTDRKKKWKLNTNNIRNQTLKKNLKQKWIGKQCSKVQKRRFAVVRLIFKSWVVSQTKSNCIEQECIAKTSQFSYLLQSIFKSVICLSNYDSFV